MHGFDRIHESILSKGAAASAHDLITYFEAFDLRAERLDDASAFHADGACLTTFVQAMPDDELAAIQAGSV
jgi:hypothetical protein